MPSTQTTEAENNIATEELFSIGELAEGLGTTTRTIRYYEECGLISPQRTNGNQRRYTRRERGRLKLILRAKEAFTLDEIKELFTIYDAQPDELGEQQQFIRLCEMMRAKISQIDAQVEQLAHLRADIQAALEDIQSKIWIQNEKDTDIPDECAG